MDFPNYFFTPPLSAWRFQNWFSFGHFGLFELWYLGVPGIPNMSYFPHQGFRFFRVFRKKVVFFVFLEIGAKNVPKKCHFWRSPRNGGQNHCFWGPQPLKTMVLDPFLDPFLEGFWGFWGYGRMAYIWYILREDSVHYRSTLGRIYPFYVGLAGGAQKGVQKWSNYGISSNLPRARAEIHVIILLESAGDRGFSFRPNFCIGKPASNFPVFCRFLAKNGPKMVQKVIYTSLLGVPLLDHF